MTDREKPLHLRWCIVRTTVASRVKLSRALEIRNVVSGQIVTPATLSISLVKPLKWLMLINDSRNCQL